MNLKSVDLVQNPKIMIRFLTTFLLLSISVPTFSQIRFSEAELLVQSRHIWRGTKLGTAPAFEPSVTFSGGRFSFNFWASVTPNNSYSEIDLVPAWQFNHFQLTVFDYYNPVVGENNNYLNFQEGKNRHSLELSIDNYSVEKPRFKWMIGTFLSGDRNKETGKSLYSTYIEFKYSFTAWSIDAEPFVGMTPLRGFYADHPALINSGISFSKAIGLSSRLSVPLTMSFLYNPYQNKSYVVLSSGISFRRLK